MFFFHKAIQELIKVSEGDMRKVRWETAMIGNVFLLKLTSFVTLISHSVKKYGEISFFFKKKTLTDAILPLCSSLHQEKD